tara:strand:- start:26 stop:562 length:537 start_codon:yes stop_codon:yes gene_type:complete
MKIIPVNHKADVLIGDYLFADKVKSEVLSLLKTSTPIPKTDTHVQAFHTEWEWQPDNKILGNLKSYVIAEIERYFKPGGMSDGGRVSLKVGNFWANEYYKGDYATSHCHKPYDYSFAYFVKAKWYYSPFIFSSSGKRIRPKEGRFVAFPSFLFHHVPKHRYRDTRVTLSSNLKIDLQL